MDTNNIKLLNDLSIGESENDRQDGLGFNTYSSIISRTIKGTPGPFTIGVFGEWGSGKTSLLRLIKNNFQKDYNVLPIWFNAWMYEKEEHPLLPLISTIVNKINNDENFWQNEKLDNKKKLLNALRAIAYGFSSKSTLKIPGFAEIEASFVAKDMIDREEKLSADPLLDKSIYYRSFERLNSVNLPKNKKIVIFIDDLDRCFPDKAIKLLESIKLVLFHRGFIFVLGVARQVIEGYLSYRYKEDFGLIEFEGQKYLDKIVQLQFPIPPHKKRIKNLASILLKQLENKDRTALLPIISIIGAACSHNPRAIVRFINNLIIDRAISDLLSPNEDDYNIPIGYFAISRGLQQRWGDLFNDLISSQELCEKFLKKFAFENEEWAIPDLDDFALNSYADIIMDEDLIHLLSSNEGRDWLKNETLRNFAIDFLKTQRETPREAPNLYSEKMEDSLGSKVRVYELAKELNFTNKNMLDYITKLGVEAKSHMSALSKRDVKLIMTSIRKDELDTEPG